MNKRRIPELLAPAGSVESLYAALEAGADAVYIGGSKFGARAYADNPEEAELLEAIDEVHLMGKRLYMTVNTLFKDRELEEELFPYLLPYYERGLDGVIVQDLGAAALMRRAFPGMELHASTQMAVTGAASSRLLKRMGFTRVVPARELSLPEIRKIYDETGMDIECFIHGAMCYSYSGMCLMSSMIGGRSGNRGRCAGVCRLPFAVSGDGRMWNGKKDAYPLNMKDMCAIELIPEMVEAGINSFKIEGRMKRPEYTAGITAVYRKYIDLYCADPGHYHVSREDMDRLYALFNRDGFNRGYYQEYNGRDMIAIRNRKTESGERDHRSAEANALYEQIRHRLDSGKLQREISGKLKLRTGEPAELDLEVDSPDGARETWIAQKGAVVQRAERQPLTEERIRGQMYKTGNSDFVFRDLVLELSPDGVFMPMKQLNQLRRDAMRALREELLQRCRRSDAVIPDSPYTLPEEGIRKDEQKVQSQSGSPLLFVLTEKYEQLAALAGAGFSEIDGWYVAAELFFGRDAERVRSLVTEILERGGSFRPVLPFVMRDKDEPRYSKLLRSFQDNREFRKGMDGILVRSIEEMGLLCDLGLESLAIPDAGLYTMNTRAERFFEKIGAQRNTMSLELNCREMHQRDNRRTELILYGRAPMMVSAECLVKTTDHCTGRNALRHLTDRRGVSFPAVCHCDGCYNVIYNSLPSSLLREKKAVMQLHLPSWRLEFTVESGAEAEKITNCFINEYILETGDPPPGDSAFTRGHFRRGVE